LQPNKRQVEDRIDFIARKRSRYVGGLSGGNAGRAVTLRHIIVALRARGAWQRPAAASAHLPAAWRGVVRRQRAPAFALEPEKSAGSQNRSSGPTAGAALSGTDRHIA
jgi:hypothetical protein